jgi:ATP-dependent helicase HrpB
VWEATARAVRRALSETEGDVLVFLPGTAEIRRTEALLAEGVPPLVDLAPLYGALPAEAQDRSIAPSPPGRRKVVLATDIAETSLTIEGVRVVVDAGLAQRPRFDPASGMERLETIRVSQASAEQRRGRAGRVAPGTCYRLWTAFEHGALPPFAPPEIAAADLAPLALELAAWGAHDPAALRWLDPPPEAAYREARALLADLGALDRSGGLTPHGRRMSTLGLHPRLAHLVLRGAELGLGGTAARLAALLAERDLLRSSGPEPPPADLRLRLDLLRGGENPGAYHGVGVDRGALAAARAEARRLEGRFGGRGKGSDAEASGLLLALAYPDRVGLPRDASGARYRLRNGRPAALPPSDALAGSEALVAAHLGGHGAEARIFLAAPLSRADLESQFAQDIETEEEVAWDDEAGLVRARRVTCLGALVLGAGPLPPPEPSAVAAALLDGVRQRGLDALPWTRDTLRLRDRLAFLHHLDPEAWPEVSDAALLETRDRWLLPHLAGMRRLEDLRRLDLGEALLTPIPWAARAALDRLAPSHLPVPSGSRVALDYSDPAVPVLAVRLQEVFGMTETPRVGGGRVPVTMHLLSPSRRPVQVTQDLASFWRTGYFDVRKDLRGRYPKHPWPEDPLSAEPTNRAKPR